MRGAGAAGEGSVSVAVRSIRSLLMVRVGGGWEPFISFLQRRLSRVGSIGRIAGKVVFLSRAVLTCAYTLSHCCVPTVNLFVRACA